MTLLKSNGSLDIERIEKLPIEKYMEVIGDLTDEQYEYYVAHMPLNESKKTVKGMIVDYSMEDEIKRGSGVNFKEYLDSWKNDSKN